MASKASALTKAASVDQIHGTNQLSATESVVVETAESYSPADSGDWTTLGSVPTAQDGALDTLAAQAAALVATAPSAAAPVWASATYDFSADGGVVGTIDLGVSIPDASIVLFSTVSVEIATDSAGNTGTLQFILPTDGALTAAYPDATVGHQDGTQDWTAANSVTTTAARSISAVIGTENLTAGKATIYVAYIPA